MGFSINEVLGFVLSVRLILDMFGIGRDYLKVFPGKV